MMNLFGSTEDMKKKIYIFFVWSYSSWNKGKKKQSAEREVGMGYCPYMVLSHDTTDCIVT